MIRTLCLSFLLALPAIVAAQDAPVRTTPLPKHVTAESQLAVERGLQYLVKIQASDGGWTQTRDGGTYPLSMTSLAAMALLAHGNTPSRGPQAESVRKAMEYVLRFQQNTGIITGPGQEQGRPMYGHGFSLMFLATLYGMENRPKVRVRLARTIEKAIELTSRGQSNVGGWTYTPGAGDEGSVTVTQIQALRAAHNAGFTVPEATIQEAIRYLERCRNADGGIRYAYRSGSNSQLAISAAAVATLYNAGDYDSDMAQSCLEFVFGRFEKGRGFSRGGHAYYSHLYASQAFYQAGDKYWDAYFPRARDQLIEKQAKDGSWEGDGIGPVYGTAIALIVLQLPYKFLPIYQR